MSDNARRNILARLRAAVPVPTETERNFDVIRARQWSREEKIERFTIALQGVHAQVCRLHPQEWVGWLTEELKARQIRKLLYAPETGIGRELAAAQTADGHGLPELMPYAEAAESFKERLFLEVDAAITTARAGIAETGSLVLWPTVDEPRLMSLVPPLHVAVVDADQLYNTFWEVMTQERWAAGLPTNALLISGPSKTADIEQTLVYGVHGPKALIVLLLDDKAGRGA